MFSITNKMADEYEIRTPSPNHFENIISKFLSNPASCTQTHNWPSLQARFFGATSKIGRFLQKPGHRNGGPRWRGERNSDGEKSRRARGRGRLLAARKFERRKRGVDARAPGQRRPPVSQSRSASRGQGGVPLPHEGGCPLCTRILPLFVAPP